MPGAVLGVCLAASRRVMCGPAPECLRFPWPLARAGPGCLAVPLGPGSWRTFADVRWSGVLHICAHVDIVAVELIVVSSSYKWGA